MFLYGFLIQNLLVTMIGCGVSTLLALLVVVPNYPCYNRNKLNWLPTPAIADMKEHTE